MVEVGGTLGVTNADATCDGMLIVSTEAAAIEMMLRDLHRFLLCTSVEEFFTKRALALTMTTNIGQRCSVVIPLIVWED